MKLGLGSFAQVALLRLLCSGCFVQVPLFKPPVQHLSGTRNRPATEQETHDYISRTGIISLVVQSDF
ncbi:hypothetical protein BJP34_17680 [Moorena producens PAL-8-15-08-1]|uniref:Uncharacterized protein n=1 Tax=Moorena producens PAL-8-15-08-1 TaxID=1458985 RepID=A0A1D8TTQ7_9CYAN|nr:hypothetical protein BJP34_17680 [Moorena producens PAL-8-15-08-1]